MTKIKTDVNFKGLKKLIKAMSNDYSVRIGILSSKGGSDTVSENLDLAGLGAVQEFGATITVTDKMRKYLASQGLHLRKDTTQITIPARSFLAMPLTQHSDLLVKKIRGGMNATEFEQAILRDEDFETLAILVAGAGIGTVQEAFETEGFGEWIPNNQFTIDQKGSSMPLVDTGSLRQHITADVNGKLVE